jgi:hypothetical protein
MTNETAQQSRLNASNCAPDIQLLSRDSLCRMRRAQRTCDTNGGSFGLRWGAAIAYACASTN